MLDRELDQLLSAVLPALPPLPPGDYVIYGAGNIGKEVLEVLTGSGRTVRAFIDAKTTGTVGGLPVYAPDHPAVFQLAGEGATVVIGIFNYTVDPWPVCELLVKAGFHRVVSFNEFQELFALAPHFWLTARSHVLEHRVRLRAAWALLEDQTSRQIFLDSIRLRLTQDLRLLREPTWGQQYLPEGLPRPPMPLRFVDGGAFTGDTLEFLLGNGATFAATAAFEPDPANFRVLAETSRRHRTALGDTSLWPCGISDSMTMASFRAGQGAGSTVVEDGDTHVQLVALDEVLPAFAPNYIKLDIEGSELAALHGAAQSIRQHQPAMAVCLYHCPEHLWEIPLYLRELLPSHRIALRYHTYQAFELVAYAFAAE